MAAQVENITENYDAQVFFISFINLHNQMTRLLDFLETDNDL